MVFLKKIGFCNFIALANDLCDVKRKNHRKDEIMKANNTVERLEKELKRKKIGLCAAGAASAIVLLGIVVSSLRIDIELPEFLAVLIAILVLIIFVGGLIGGYVLGGGVVHAIKLIGSTTWKALVGSMKIMFIPINLMIAFAAVCFVLPVMVSVALFFPVIPVYMSYSDTVQDLKDALSADENDETTRI